MTYIHRTAGFTLIELLVVLVIMSLMTALATPLLSGALGGAGFYRIAHDLADSLRDTRDRAIQSGAAADFTIDLAAGKFSSGANDLHDIPTDVRVALVTTTDQKLGATTGTIRFFADGSSTGGGLGLQQGSRRENVLVDWVTGRISIGTPP